MIIEFTYKNFYMLPEYSFFDKCWHGRAKQFGNDDLITCEGETLGELKWAFEEMVDGYLEWCGSSTQPHK
jgi:predicted HicB family RNase H-like nuclease